jgi:sterol desaturase/sphingolipid hydroxylase (fatty acid hydroxylase superfamily)/predicted amino acid dehydrogenase
MAHIESFSQKWRILDKNPPRKQLAQEVDWDNPLVGSVAAFLLVQICTPWLNDPGEFSSRSLGLAILGHYLIVEPLYYAFHRALHWPKLYKYSHSHHHSSVITESISGTSHPWHEALGYLAIFSFPILVPAWFGHFSYEIIYIYFVFFDIMNCIGHCNFECVPVWLQWGPLKYLYYCSAFHSEHHTKYKKNYCLFCPLWDFLMGTVSKETYKLQQRARTQTSKKVSVVFLGHGLGWSSLLHLPMVSPILATQRHTVSAWMYPFLPFCLAAALLCRLFRRTSITLQRYMYANLSCASWSIPVLAYSYMYKQEHPHINRLLLQAIRDAEAQGATHVGLGALNKAQGLNNNGADLVPFLHPGCRTKIVHGNTLTAAVVYSRIRQHAEPGEELVFTGATSCVAKPVVLRLLGDGYKIRVLSRSAERFSRLQAEAGKLGAGLSRIGSYEEGADCQKWVLGTTVDRSLEGIAQKDTVFLEFAVPCAQDEFLQPGKVISAASIPIDSHISDITFCHSHDRCPEEVTVPSCLAAAIIHGLEGFNEHEVGDIDGSRLDMWLALAKKHGFDVGDWKHDDYEQQMQNKHSRSESEPEEEPDQELPATKKRRVHVLDMDMRD